MCEIGLLSSVPNAWEKYTIIMLYLQGGCCNTTHFVTFTWAHWQDIQAQAVQNFTRFQRAISQQQPQLAALIALEMLHIAAEPQKEAVAWIGVK